MDTPDLLAVGLVMAVGLVGIAVPAIPGLLLIEAAAIAWCFLEGAGLLRWFVLAGITAVVVLGTVAKYVVPSRSMQGAGVPRLALITGVAVAVAGFFAIPVVGAPLGFIGGVFAAEALRVRDIRAAGRSTVSALKALGISMLVELTAGVTAISIWVVGVVLVHA